MIVDIKSVSFCPPPLNLTSRRYFLSRDVYLFMAESIKINEFIIKAKIISRLVLSF